MKRIATLFALAFASTVAPAADIGVSVSVGQPGFHGRLDIGSFPQPVLVYPRPAIAVPGGPPGRAPIYLHVPPGHAKDWPKHCAKYAACGQPVYFVDPRWYEEVYVPRYREMHPNGGARPQARAWGRNDRDGGDDRKGRDKMRREDRERGDDRHEGRRGDHGNRGAHGRDRGPGRERD